MKVAKLKKGRNKKGKKNLGGVLIVLKSGQSRVLKPTIWAINFWINIYMVVCGMEELQCNYLNS